MSLNEITVKDVTQLELEELVKLIDLLIAGELSMHFLPSQIDIASVPRPITVQDGGEDAHCSFPKWSQ